MKFDQPDVHGLTDDQYQPQSKSLIPGDIGPSWKESLSPQWVKNTLSIDTLDEGTFINIDLPNKWDLD